MRSAITGSITTIGIPEQRAAELVGIRGVGVLDGNYRVLGFTQRAQAGEWTMVMQLQNNATSSTLISDFFSLRPPSTNEEEPPASSANDAASGGGASPVEPVPA